MVEITEGKVVGATSTSSSDHAADQTDDNKNDGSKDDNNEKNDLEEESPNKSNGNETGKEENDDNEEQRQISTGTSHDKSVRSYSCYPVNYVKPTSDASEKKEQPPAKTYAYTLDPFQAKAINYIEQYSESVLVAAHTSAGKTTVAEYAIAKCLRDGQRAIYTSPIKALSNQKYRDLSEEFGAEQVGLMTGDITINPSAVVLVMTTEILRSMLYRGSEVMREVAWVIYDEIHYMRDKERGVVWEESIILLPHRVKFVFLSATIPNSEQFANWICQIHHQPCHVLYTNYRPVPLQHYIFPKGGDGLYLVVDERGKFRSQNFQKAMARLQATTGGGGEDPYDTIGTSGAMGKAKKRKRNSATIGAGGKDAPPSDLHRIVKLIMDRNLNPVIVFSFSKKDCETYALQLKRQDFNSNEEKELIGQVYHNAIEQLSEQDRTLPQVEALLPLLKRGIGVHHGGLLSILKEIVEILFAEGLIKVLFATETFAIGINMPAKTVVFTSTRKWDGVDFRWISSGEYIQMSGRAGRRGKDDRGIVIQMMDESIEPDVSKQMLYGDPDPLNSSYHIKYHMLLNMMRVEEVDPEFLLRASFHQFQQADEAPKFIQKADELEEQLKKLKDQSASSTINKENEAGSDSTTTEKVEKKDSDSYTDGSTNKKAAIKQENDIIREYYELQQQLDKVRSQILQIVREPEYIVPFLTGGRLIDVSIKTGESKSKSVSYGWGVVVSTTRKHLGTGSAGTSGKQARDAAAAASAVQERLIEVLLPCIPIHQQRSSSTSSSDEKSKTNNNKSRKKSKKGNKNDDNLDSSQNSSGELFPWKGAVDTCLPVSVTDDLLQESVNKEVQMRLFTINLSDVQGISAVKLFVPQDLKREESRTQMLKTFITVQKRFMEQQVEDVDKDDNKKTEKSEGRKANTKENEGEKIIDKELLQEEESIQKTAQPQLPLLDYVTDMGIKTDDFKALLEEETSLRTKSNQLKGKMFFTDEDLQAKLKIHYECQVLLNEIKYYRQKAKECQSLIMVEELRAMKKVLKKLEHVDEDGIITLKGRTACEINTTDELVVVELVFSGVFADLTVEQCVALLSCMTYDEKANKDTIEDVLSGYKSFLVNPFIKLQQAAKTVAKAQIECNVPNLSPDYEADFVESFRPDLMEAVFAWCKGASFHTVQQLAQTYEGSTIRCLRRLEELVRQLAAACQSIGNLELQSKFTKGSELIRRDIVFCSSLYL